jgi:hypothetical protein
MKTLITLIFSTLASFAFAQSIHSGELHWNVEQLNDVNAGQSSVFNCLFTSSPTAINWIQNEGEYTTSFPINSVSGTWSDVQGDGSVTFYVTFQDKTGEVTFSRENGLVTIRMKFMEQERNTTPYVFEVSTITQP